MNTLANPDNLTPFHLRPDQPMNTLANPDNSKLLLFVKAECETCQLVVPAIEESMHAGNTIEILVQDDASFLNELGSTSDLGLEESFRWDVETTPTLIHVGADGELARVEGWDREGWQRLKVANQEFTRH